MRSGSESSSSPRAPTSAASKNASTRAICLDTPQSARFGGDQLPVGIVRAQLAGEGPDIGHLAHPLGTAVDNLARLVARRRHELGYEAHGDLGGVALDLGGRDLGLGDRDEAR